MKIYNKPKSNQAKEKSFQTYLLTKLKEYKHVNETYTLCKDEFASLFIDVRKIERQLKIDNSISDRKKASVINILSKLPHKVRVAEACNLVSVDFLVVDAQNQKTYIEFHERQHRALTVNSLTPVFDNQFNRYEIPRFVQRILKDIWRFENLPNYKIVWFDWFCRLPIFSTVLNYTLFKLINSSWPE
jgi:hypothetical protein